MDQTDRVAELLAELEAVKLKAYLDMREAFQVGYDLGVENATYRPNHPEESDVVWRRYIYFKEQL